jgi:cytochrome d ubiquinol oxidase subunit I
VTEIGRQPYLVSGVLTVKDAATDIAPVNVGISLTLYLLTYVILMAAYLHTIFNMARHAVEIEEISDAEDRRLNPQRLTAKETANA